MKYKTTSLLVYCVLFCFSFFSCQSQFHDTITVDSIKNIANNDQNILYDVRTPAEFNQSRLKGAVHNDVLEANFTSNLEGLDKSKSYYVYCRTGRRAVKAANMMKQKGFESVYLLEEGMMTYPAKIPELIEN